VNGGGKNAAGTGGRGTVFHTGLVRSENIDRVAHEVQLALFYAVGAEECETSAVAVISSARRMLPRWRLP
jgi:hypothetical protein